MLLILNKLFLLICYFDVVLNFCLYEVGLNDFFVLFYFQEEFEDLDEEGLEFFLKRRRIGDGVIRIVCIN